MKFVGFINKSIEYLFYSLFFLVPIVFAGNTSELFEFNKMWLTFGITILIGFFWFSKMILQRRIIFKRTILDIPILLFLISQVVSTVISIDPYVSFWGYYSRWNGGLLSTITYIFLFYAFVSNFEAGGASGADERQDPRTMIVRNSLLVSLISGFFVVIWAIPSHFGYDPTCFVFRGNFDVSCWTADFQPRVRIFGPMGQPDWLAGYLGVILPIAAAFILNELRSARKLLDPRLIFYTVSFFLFYLALLYTGSRSGIAGTILALTFFFFFYVFLNRKSLDFVKNKFVPIFIGAILAVSFIVGIQVPVLNKFSLSQVKTQFQKQSSQPARQPTQTSQSDQPASGISALDSGGSSSLQIRKIVWRGAFDVFRANPVFGTGVETFAYAYYKYRPIEHNRLSEWNFLYNKAHNEYLNYLATTGILGLGTYLLFVGLFGAVCLLNLLNIKVAEIKYIGVLSSEKWDNKDPILLSLFASFLAILMINFFGFSVVILNIYLLLIPAFVLIILGLIKIEDQEVQVNNTSLSYGQWAGISFLAVSGIFMLWFLIRYWIADTKYALGYNYNSVREFQTAYPLLHDAVKLRGEPVYLDQMAVNDVFIAAGLVTQGATESAQIAQNLAREGVQTSDKLVRDYPHNIVFWKNRVRILYTLASIDSDFLPAAFEAIKKAAELAPTDASVLYNLGLIYGQNADLFSDQERTNYLKKAVEVLEKTVSYKPDYRDAHFALGLFYHDLGVNEKAIDQMKFILEKINPEDSPAKESLDLWEKEE